MYPSTLSKDKDIEYSTMSKKFKDKLEITKTEWFTKIDDLIKSSRDLHRLAEVQVLLLSYRHQLTDYAYGDLSKAIISIRTIYDKNKKNCLLDSKVNFDFKLNTEKERFIVLDADLRIIEEMVEMFDSQMNFIKESIKVLDNLGFSIKSRLEMHKLISGDSI